MVFFSKPLLAGVLSFGAVVYVIVTEEAKEKKKYQIREGRLDVKHLQTPSLLHMAGPVLHAAAGTFMLTSYAAGLYSPQHFSSIAALRQSALAFSIFSGAATIPFEFERTQVTLDLAPFYSPIIAARMMHVGAALGLLLVELLADKEDPKPAVLYLTLSLGAHQLISGKWMQKVHVAHLGAWMRQLGYRVNN